MGVPPILINFSSIFSYIPSIVGYPHFRKPPYNISYGYVSEFDFQIWYFMGLSFGFEAIVFFSWKIVFPCLEVGCVSFI